MAALILLLGQLSLTALLFLLLMMVVTNLLVVSLLLVVSKAIFWPLYFFSTFTVRERSQVKGLARPSLQEG
jgi:hypothetical protein